MDRLISRRRLLGAAGAGAVSAVVAACSGSSRRSPSRSTLPGPTTTARVPALRIGYVAEVTGPNSSRGQFVAASLAAMTGYLQAKQNGQYRGVSIELVPVDAPTGADGPRAYAELVSRQVHAILWCTPFGLVESLPSVMAGTVPVISVLADPYSYADATLLSGARAKGSPLFQTSLPDRHSVDLLCAYLAEDRGFSTAALFFDKAAYPGVDVLYTASAKAHNLVNQGVFTFDTSSGHVDWSAALSSLKRIGVHALLCYALADDASVVATQLQTLDAKYKDTPTTLQSPFKPMLVGAPWGTGDPGFIRLAGDAAARGTMSATALGSVMTLPDFPIRRWLHDYVPTYNGGLARGGENAPADAVAVVADAVLRSGSTAGPAIIAGLESGAVTTFASSVGLSFAADRHVAVGPDDAVLLSLDWPPGPYNLGAEWHDVLPDRYQGPNHLVDFTVAANTRAHPGVTADLLQRRYGISATDAYQGGDAAKVAACKAVH